MPLGPSSRASDTQISRVPYLPGLDGMRALAVLAVMVYHAHQWLNAGFLGVEVFFVISGYLITLLLIAEHERDGQVRLRQFWLRRFRRLLPALYVCLILVTLYCLLGFPKALGRLRGDVIAAVTYSTNWFQIYSGQGYTSAFDFVPLRHLWSLAVEEQFYLVWPLAMLLILRKGRANLPKVGLMLFGLVIAISLVMAVMFHAGPSTSCAVDGGGLGPPCTTGFAGRQIETNNFLYLGTITRSTGILLGAAFAMIWRPLAIMRGPLRNKSRLLDFGGLIGLAIIGLLSYKMELYSSFNAEWYGPIFRGGLLLTSLATLMVIAAVTHRRSLIGRALANPVLNWVGTRSYGLYLFHWPIYQIIRKQAGIQLSVTQMALALLLTGSIAETSYRYVETPIRHGRLSEWWRNRRRLSPERRRQSIIMVSLFGFLLGVLGVVLFTAKLKCTNEIECSLVNNVAIADGPSGVPTAAPPPTADPNATTTTGAPVVTIPGETTTTPVPTTVEPTTTVAALKLDPFAVGDSVMLGAVNKLNGVPGAWADAQQNRQGTKAAEILENAQAQAFFGNTVIIHIGTNGPLSDETIARWMAATANVPHVYVLTVKADVAWIAGNNEKLRALPATHGNVLVLDWEAYANANPQFLYGDHTHLKGAEGTSAYANFIFTSIGLPTIP
jgi:peptidoglycan/LPS O-acetylase OafA/YrhL